MSCLCLHPFIHLLLVMLHEETGFSARDSSMLLRLFEHAQRHLDLPMLESKAATSKRREQPTIVYSPPSFSLQDLKGSTWQFLPVLLVSFREWFCSLWPCNTSLADPGIPQP